jgi:hypothetical protein
LRQRNITAKRIRDFPVRKLRETRDYCASLSQIATIHHE